MLDASEHVDNPIRLIRMPTVPANLQPLLADLRAALEDLYGDRLVRLVLYGSQARGDAM